MIANRGQLVTAIYQWLIRDQLTDNFVNLTLVGTYIQLAESEFNRELKIMELEETVPISTVGTDDFVTFPSDFRGIKSFEFNSRPFDIEWFATRRAMKEKYSSEAGRPAAFFILGNKAIFPGAAQGVNAMTLDYYKAVPPLTEANPTNIILEKYPDAYLYGSIRQALINLNIQNRLETVAPLYNNILDRIKEADKNARFPAGARGRVQNVIGG